MTSDAKVRITWALPAVVCAVIVGIFAWRAWWASSATTWQEYPAPEAMEWTAMLRDADPAYAAPAAPIGETDPHPLRDGIAPPVPVALPSVARSPFADAGHER